MTYRGLQEQGLPVLMPVARPHPEEVQCAVRINVDAA